MGKMIGRGRRALMAVTCAGALGVAAIAPAVAHPHVWVNVETTVLIEQGSVVGFQHRWTFDEFYTAMAIQGLDANNDGTYSREELAELAKVNIDGLKDFGFFTFAKLGDKQLELDAPKDYWLDHGPATTGTPPAAAQAAAAAAQPTGPAEQAQPGIMSRLKDAVLGSSKPGAAAAEPAKVLSLVFTAPLKQPVLAEAPDFTFSVYDPSWFIAFELAGGDALKLGPGAPAGCRLDTGEAAKPSADEAKRIEDAFSGQFGGPGTVNLSGTKLVKLNCGPRS